MIKIRRFENTDWPAVWTVIAPVFRAGETYAFPPHISEEEAQKIWIDKPRATYVAVDGSGQILGTYYIKANQPALGDHVCNCGYIVSRKAEGRGIASKLCAHSQAEAISLGFRAMQYNLVVSTNKNAIYLWKKHGFDIVGTLPGAFRHLKLGFVDALVMFKQLK